MNGPVKYESLLTNLGQVSILDRRALSYMEVGPLETRNRLPAANQIHVAQVHDQRHVRVSHA